VALKFLPASYQYDPERRARFLREARAASALTSPNIAAIYDIGDHDGSSFIVMEYVEGVVLSDRLRQGPLAIPQALDVATQLMDALDEAHSRGVIHRDIKSSNLIITERGLVKVLDFGLAKLTEAPSLATDSEVSTPAELSTEPGLVMGTFSYMSPEQARGQKVDARSDIFSLGVVLYEMLAGRRPFEGATMSDVIAALLTAEPPPLGRHRPEATAELEQIVGMCLAKDREARYQSAADLIADLKKLQMGGQMAEATTRRVEETRPWSASWRWLLIPAMALLLVVGLAWLVSWRRAPAVPPDQIKSLAVLPLENITRNPAQEYFADGMTEALISNLAQIRALRVISRTSVMRFKGSLKPVAEIAKELNVDAVIEGSVQRDGERLKITANLIQASTDTPLWTGTYDRELKDVLRLQNEVAHAIIQGIQIKLTSQEQSRLESARPINPAAYDEYLRGRFYTYRQIKDDNETAIKALERAVSLDPSFAAAHAELAQAYVWRLFLFTPGEKEWQEKAYVSVAKALDLDQDSAVAHQARGRLLWTPANRFPHENAIKEYRRALALNPNLDEAQNQLALVYNHIGAFDQALQELQKAVAVNPANNLAQFRIGQTLLLQGNYEQALTALHKSPVEANPSLVGSNMPMALLHLGKTEQAADMVEEFLRNYPGDTDGGLFTGIQALIAALAGANDKAESKIRIAVEKGKGFGHFHHTAYNIACAYSVMKKAGPAITWLQKATDDGFPCYPLFEKDPYLDHLRTDPRFVALMANLKAQWERFQTIL